MEHLLASHHGLSEWGSLISCNVPEAVILHKADSIDADLWKFKNAYNKLKLGCMDTMWDGNKYRNIYNPIYKDIKI